jgi:hypothetical protein
MKRERGLITRPLRPPPGFIARAGAKGLVPELIPAR